MPWVGRAREEKGYEEFMDCTDCKANLTTVERGMRGCGYLPPGKRSGTFRSDKLPAVESDMCPGWLITLPQALEAARASGWRTQLGQFYEGLEPTGVLMDAIDVFSHEIEVVKAAIMADASGE